MGKVGERFRTRRAVALTVTFALLVGVGAVALWWQRTNDCWEPPSWASSLAEDPDRAAAVLDPGRNDRLEELLPPSGGRTCEGESSGELVGRVLFAATTGRTAAELDQPARPHTEAQLRIVDGAFDVLTVESQPLLEDGAPLRDASPHLARIAADHLPDVLRSWFSGARDVEITQHEPEVRGSLSSAGQEVLFHRLAADPVSFAVLYDAVHAHAANRLDRHGAPRHTREDEDNEDGSPLVEGVALGTLMGARHEHVLNGVVPDVEEFDRQVSRHSAGQYRAARKAAGSPRTAELSGAIAQRRVDRAAGAVNHKLLSSGRAQYLALVEEWGRDREVPSSQVREISYEFHRAYQGQVVYRD